MRKALAVILLLFTVRLLFADIVSRIIITGNRVDESVIRSRLTFKEGDDINELKIQKSKANLYSLGLFKSLDFSLVKDTAASGVDVNINARDGWYILPWPFFGSRGGTRYGGGMLLEQNLFKRAERVLLFGNYSDIMQMNSVSFIFPGFSLSGSVDRQSYTEYLFADGAYNAKEFEGHDVSKIPQYGQVVNSYEKDLSGFRINAGKSFGDSVRGSFGFNAYNVKYADALIVSPVDTGKINSVQASVSFGRFESRMDMLYNFGRIFGLGMADLEDSLKTLACARSDYGLSLSAEDAGYMTGSEFDFTKLSVSADRITTFCDKSRLSIFLKGGIGAGVPESQLFATNRQYGMLGTYAREFRGDRIAVSNINYRHPFVRNKTGQLVGEAFAEFASAYSDQWNSKEGAGINLSYQFWRFPLPLGFGYTYAFDDNDWQVSASIGGAF